MASSISRFQSKSPLLEQLRGDCSSRNVVVGMRWHVGRSPRGRWQSIPAIGDRFVHLAYSAAEKAPE